MEPRIQYAKTEDGVSIAYWTIGEGPPLLFLSPLLLGSSETELQSPYWRAWYESLSATHKLIRYDARGSGMSDRATEFTLDALLQDVIAVVDHLALGQVNVFASTRAAQLGIALAARHPERVNRLIVWRGSARGDSGDFGNLAEKNWEVFSEVVGHSSMGWDSGQLARLMASYIRDSFTPETYQQVRQAMTTLDVAGLPQKVAVPTLVITRRSFEPTLLEHARDLAAAIPQARLVLLDGESAAPFGVGIDEMEPVLRATNDFLAEGQSAPSQPTYAPPGLVTILFTDLTSSTELTQRLGDAKAQELVRAHNTIVREALSGHGGTEIKHTGDGIMASFGTASGALDCAIAIQRAVAERDEANLQVHVGVNAGEPVAEESDLYGTSVQLARRICDSAAGGEILASNVVRELAAGKDFLFADRGDIALRGFENPVRVYEVRWREDESS
ncbi:MAG: adenylate/guanylate cyclase domain-containing protein [Dehalococcoidia bacterium]